MRTFTEISAAASSPPSRRPRWDHFVARLRATRAANEATAEAYNAMKEPFTTPAR